jgi:hypothetical protein
MATPLVTAANSLRRAHIRVWVEFTAQVVGLSLAAYAMIAMPWFRASGRFVIAAPNAAGQQEHSVILASAGHGQVTITVWTLFILLVIGVSVSAPLVLTPRLRPAALGFSLGAGLTYLLAIATGLAPLATIGASLHPRVSITAQSGVWLAIAGVGLTALASIIGLVGAVKRRANM